MKLPGLAQGLDAAARRQAAWAVGSTLFWRGRFTDARKWLPPSPELGWTLALQGESAAALALPENPSLHFYLDDAQACERGLHPCEEPVQAAGNVLLRYWVQSRRGEPVQEAAAQAALADLRRRSPCDEGRGMAIYAIAAYHQHPAYALPHLDHALELFARYGLHYLEARLLDLKARALDANGQLGEAGRFEIAAREAVRRQSL